MILRTGWVFVLVATAIVAGAQTQPDPQSVLDQIEERLFPESFTATMRMYTDKPGQRPTEMVLDSSHREGAGTFMVVQAPSRSRGMRFLQKEDDLWMYNPRSGSRRAIRLSPRDSFQGSVFSNNDAGDPDYSDDYTAELIGRERLAHPELGSVDCWVVEATARHERATYGRIVMYATVEDLMPLFMEYYAKSGLLFKRMYLFELKRIAGAIRPTVWRMESLEQVGAYTLVTIEALEARDDLPGRLFNQAQLTR